MSFTDWMRAVCAMHRPEVPMSPRFELDDDTRQELAEQLGDALAAMVRSGYHEDAAVNIIADILDALIVLPEPLDTGSDVAIMVGLKAVAEVMRRDPAKMDARADELAAAGKKKRAARLRARAEKVRARQA